ncbi:MAG TPA: VCBS repeat-containing protein [Verrucomicrobiae bacterium]|nr:VCBS repeat-containing protein [Verrucomicrobiae bacterium]
MRKICFIAALLTLAVIASAEDHFIHSFKKIQLSDQFWAEGATFGDFNHDGKGDVVAGPYWWEGPDFKKRHEYYPATQTFKRKKQDGTEETIPGFEGALGVNNTYSDNFFAFTQDFNKDGWDDILIYGFPGKDASWFENPKGKEGHWNRHKVLDIVDNESPAWGDITGDRKNEIICSSEGYYGYAEPNLNDPAQPWKFTRISAKGGWQRFTHGLGFGDVNGDGKMDLLEKDGWWEQPASAGADTWKQHKRMFGTGGAQMYTYDVNGDGLNDVITSIAAHGYGLAWYEQLREKQDGEIQFKEHIFMNKAPKENK